MELKDLRPKEREKWDVAEQVVELGCTDVAIRRGRTRLGCTRKTLIKYVSWYKKQDISLFCHSNRGRKPSTTKAEETKNRVKELYREKYNSANFTHFGEILAQDYNISLSDGTLHSILKNACLVSPSSHKATKRAIEKRLRQMARKEHLGKEESEHINAAFNILDGSNAHPRRARSKYFGELIQMDASEYVWVAGRKKWHLHVAIDDATSEVVGAYFDEQETLSGYYHVLYMILKLYGIPSRFRTDRRTVFEYNLRTEKDEEKDTYTQFAAACKTLGIEIETSSIAQHKGRVERLNKSLQGRLPVEFIRHGITTMQEANAFLWQYLPRFNKQFSLKDEKDLQSSTFIQSPSESEINSILAVVSIRIIDTGNSIKYLNSYYLPHIVHRGALIPKFYYKGTKALLIKAFDGSLLANIKETIHILVEIEKRSCHSKEFDPQASPSKRKVYKPADDHPWRSKFLNSKVLESHITKAIGSIQNE